MTGDLLWFIIALKITMAVVFLRAFIKTGRRSALMLSLGWVTSSSLPAHFPDPHLELIIMGLSSSLTLLGIILLFEEESGRKAPSAMHVALPTVPLIYGGIESLVPKACGCTYVVAGVLLFIGGVVVIELLSRYYRKKACLFGVVILLSGISSMVYPLNYMNSFVPEEVVVYSVVGLALLTAYAYYELIYSPRFMHLDPSKIASLTEELSGVHILSRDEFERIKEKTKDFPVLAFLRTVKPSDEWIVYRIQTISTPHSVPPTALYRLTDLTVQYFKELNKAGKRGIVIIESPEFLKIYNDFRSVLKMLATLRDAALMFGGGLLVITEKEVWKEEEWNLLIRTLG